ncbi:MAG TPA: CpcT/CpeT family chromophore lyase [Steroidobacteraceae bacterium]|nr:CpcT/CpeT family chromophore lyase [Steroidobacteraceae bacterium]
MAGRTIAAAALALLAGGCASRPDAGAQFMDQLQAALAGSYDNLAQSRAAADHAPLRLMIAPVAAPLVGDHVFYVQEMAADDARRVLAQHLYTLDAVAGREAAVLSQADFAEPLRWRDGQLDRDLFRSLLPQDLRPRAGCDLLFTREGAGFVAATSSTCRGSARDTGEALRVEQRITVDADGIALFEQQRDAAGKLVYGDQPDPWYRFARRADAPW